MTRLLASLTLVAALTCPVPAQEASPPLSPADLAAQNQAIATAVQEQLLACWRLPSGYKDRSIAVGLAFFGDGTLDGDPYLELESVRTAGKYPVLMQSVAEAIASCLPFAGLEALGAGAGERFDITVHFRS